MNNLDDLLRDALTDDRWALAVPPDALGRLRNGKARRQRRAAAVRVASVLGIAAVGAGAYLSLPSPAQDSVRPSFATGLAAPDGSALAHGRDWLLSAATSPDDPEGPPGPTTRPVYDSPAEQQALAVHVRTSSLPADAKIVITDGEGQARVTVTLADGTVINVYRGQADRPFLFRANGGDGVNADASLVDVPGTNSAAVLYPRAGHGNPDGDPYVPGVMVVNPAGVVTTWYGVNSVPMSTLRAWAFTAAVGVATGGQR